MVCFSIRAALLGQNLEEGLTHMLPRYLCANGPNSFWLCGPVAGAGGEKKWFSVNGKHAHSHK